MKLLCTLGYLMISALKAPLANAQQARGLDAAVGRKRSAFLNYFLGIVLLFLGFVQFWLLTRMLPMALFAVLVVASLFGLTLDAIIGAVAGFGIEEKKRKVGVLSVIWGITNPAIGCIAATVAILVTVVGTAGSLWIFWRHPIIGEASAVGWIAFYEFIMPQLAAVLLLLLISWPMMTSEFVDDDCRNAFLSSQFTRLFAAAVVLVYPAWIFQSEIGVSLGYRVPFWLLLSFPFFGFLIGAAVPHIIGTRKHRSQRRVLLSWRRTWLTEALKMVKLPVGEARSNGLDNRLRDLEREIQKRIEGHGLFEFYQKLVVSETAGEDRLSIPVASEPSTPLLSAASEPIASIGGLAVRGTDFFKRAQRFAPTPSVSPMGSEENPIERVHRVVRENKQNLVEWDVSFAHISKLLDLRLITIDGKTKDLSSFIEVHLSDLDSQISSLDQGKSVVAVALWTFVSGAAPFLFKTFQAEITSFIRGLVPS